MEHPDTSDLYKFFTTLGILLIVSSLIIFWTILNSYDIFLIKNEDLDNLTLLAKENIIKRQEFISLIYHYRFLITSIIFIFGIIELFYGIKKWKVRQIIIDRTQEQEYLKLFNAPERQSDEQINEKLRNEVIEIRGEELDSKIPIDITDYKNIEKKVIGIINKKYNDFFMIRNNVIFEDIGYDIIMIPKKKSISENIFNIEIKYYSKEIRYADLINGYRGYLLLANKFNEYFKNKSKNNIVYVLLCIYNSNNNLDKLNNYKERILESIENKMNLKVKIIIIEENDIEKLSLSDFL